MNWLLINVPLMIAFAALWIGVPAWLVLGHSGARPEPALAREV